MPELAYMQEQHGAAMPKMLRADGLTELLRKESALAIKCGRAVLHRLALPPNEDNARLITLRIQNLQREHDGFVKTVAPHSSVSTVQWETFLREWSEIPVLDMNILCEYCAEAGRDLRKRIRAGKTDSDSAEQRIRAICVIGCHLPAAAVSNKRALCDFYQQGILDMRRLRTALLDAGYSAELADGAIAVLSAEKKRIC